ncbi:alpha/beta fold hydrolase [Motiliproteus sediminis]|uniref:alpha/beta fold hydrolase n=1 Tax=Motiliproteus sediminis TaxID=1468178 RepID=UPI001FE708B5|nr:alpha/beta hydrolase [Motiliproteus sediminis]
MMTATAMQWRNGQVEVEGVALSIRFGQHPEGTGKPVLLLLHEALGSFAQWKRFPEQLAEACGMSVLLYEREGHGGSDPLRLPRADDYLQYQGRVVLPRLIDALSPELGLEQLVLVGHSDGGSIALVGAAEMRQRVVALITAAAHLFVEPETRAGIEAAVAVYADKLRAPLARYHGDKIDDLFRGWHQTWLRNSFQGLDLSPWLGRIQCPALVMQGRNDQYGSAAQVEQICAGINAGGRALARPCWVDAGHVPHLETPQQTLAAMSGFIAALGPVSGRAAATV